MQGMRTWGGIAALVEAATYLIGFAMIATVLSPLAGDLDAAGFFALLAERQGLMFVWNLLIYVVNGAFLVLLVLAMHERLAASSPRTTRVASAFGLLWAGFVLAAGMLILNDLSVVAALATSDPALAAPVWTTLQAVENGLGGAVELPGGVWVALVSLAAHRAGALPRALNALGAVVGVAGVLTLAPVTDVFETVFGLGMIVWFAWTGIVLLRDRRRVPAGAPAVPVRFQA